MRGPRAYNVYTFPFCPYLTVSLGTLFSSRSAIVPFADSDCLCCRNFRRYLSVALASDVWICLCVIAIVSVFSFFLFILFSSLLFVCAVEKLKWRKLYMHDIMPFSRNHLEYTKILFIHIHLVQHFRALMHIHTYSVWVLILYLTCAHYSYGIDLYRVFMIYILYSH